MLNYISTIKISELEETKWLNFIRIWPLSPQSNGRIEAETKVWKVIRLHPPNHGARGGERRLNCERYIGVRWRHLVFLLCALNGLGGWDMWHFGLLWPQNQLGRIKSRVPVSLLISWLMWKFFFILLNQQEHCSPLFSWSYCISKRIHIHIFPPLK